MSHAILYKRLARLFKDDDLLYLAWQIIGAYRTAQGRGLPIGSLTSQHFANFYLGWFDRFVKETLRVPAYVRYMDDMVLWWNSAEELQWALRQCTEYLTNELQLELKPTPYINRTSHGMDFLGCRVFPKHFTLNRHSRVRSRRAALRLERLYLNGRIGESELQRRGTALFAFMQAGGCASWKFRRRLLKELPVSGY